MMWLLLGCAPDIPPDLDPVAAPDSAEVVPVEVIAGDTAADTGEITRDTADISDHVDPPRGDPALLCQAALRCDAAIPDDPKRPCTLRIDSGDGDLVYDAMAMVERRGRSSAGFVKPPYAVELHDSVTELVLPGDTWRYFDGVEAPEGWAQLDYADGTWPSGAAPLGYGDAQATVLDYGPDPDHKPPVAWFRHVFSVEDPSAVAELTLALVRDDGAVVWLNGVEVVRSNVAEAAGSAGFATSTTSGASETEWWRFDLDPARLQAGENVLAVEVHQATADSSDLSFAAQLYASAGRETPNLFGMGGEDDWLLQSAYIDRVLWRNKLAYDLFQSFGGTERWAAEQVFCELSLNDTYEGVYLLGELPRRDDDRLPLARSETGESFLVKLDDELGFRTNTVGFGEWQAVYPAQTEENAGAIAGVDAALAAWEAEVLAGSETQWELFDVDSAVDWVILEELFKNNDAYFLSVHLWRDTGGSLHVAPWDFDLTLGYPYYDCGPTGWVGRQPYVEAWAASPRFRARLVERWAELRAAELTDAAILARVTGYEATMGDAIVRNFERWPVADIAFGWGGVDNWLCPVTTWEQEHDHVLAWIPQRTAWMDANIARFGE